MVMIDPEICALSFQEWLRQHREACDCKLFISVVKLFQGTQWRNQYSLNRITVLELYCQRQNIPPLVQASRKPVWWEASGIKSSSILNESSLIIFITQSYLCSIIFGQMHYHWLWCWKSMSEYSFPSIRMTNIIQSIRIFFQFSAHI